MDERDPIHPPHAVEFAVKILQQGGIIALPTETVYGLAADAENEVAVRRIFAAKGRPSTHPLIVHVANLEAAQRWVRDFPKAAEILAERFWPGPLTLVVAKNERASDVVTGGQATVGLRVPSHALALAVIRQFGGGIAAPSANRFGHVSPTTAEHVVSDLGNKVDFVLDGGPCSVGVESTIVDVAHGAPRILRPGGLSLEAIEDALGQRVPIASDAANVRAPGMLASHYAPRAGLIIAEADELEREVTHAVRSMAKVVVMAAQRIGQMHEVEWIDMPEGPDEFARVLYGRLREADSKGDLIVVVPPAALGLGLAARDRLRRAAAPRDP